uniref:Carcinustatin-19 n=1 Tax=Carcinus maenas TaxID=6759 RepID=ALL19_CARMA|nr:RecName: Full=Carcinustatin-19 [Carcinus maenas]
APTDMYSFGL